MHNQSQMSSVNGKCPLSSGCNLEQSLWYYSGLKAWPQPLLERQHWHLDTLKMEEKRRRGIFSPRKGNINHDMQDDDGPWNGISGFIQQQPTIT